RYGDKFNILMIASLRNYKGVPELLKLAEKLKYDDEVHFHLLVNDDQETIDRYFKNLNYIHNLTVYPRSSDTCSFYRKANLVLNLSRVDQCVETFGMTVLEAMSFGIPIIAPPVGGPSELVSDGFNGFLIDSRNIELLYEKILELK